MAAPSTKLNGNQLNIAERTNNRVTELRLSVMKTRYQAEVRRLEERYQKKYKIPEKREAVEAAEEALRKARNVLRLTMEQVENAVSSERAALEDKLASEMEEENFRSTGTSLQLLSLSLPPDVAALLEIDKTRKLLKG